MKKDLKDYISRCPECQLNRSASRTHAPLPIQTCSSRCTPFERWGIDFYGPMVETKSGSKYLDTCIDYATRWVLAKPVREMTEAAVATFLYDLMMNYGAPFEIISDRGKSFLAEGISEFERENSIRHLATTPYHPQTNGMMKHHDRQKLEFNWKGPYHVVDVGHPGTYWIMTPQGLRLPNAVNQADLAPWLAPVIDNVDFFYDGTNQNSSLDS
ncbi:hypothetical protein BASA83_007404 [Batrachochytrium salamandrivorans]|nr:hypothetical protein BASA83_007404 [Batrachochytrium salamandrivorans]